MTDHQGDSSRFTFFSSADGTFIVDGHEISEADYRHIYTDPRPRSRCCWCKRIIGHAEGCVTHQWEPEMPWGKYKGRKLKDVPDGALTFYANEGLGTEQLQIDIQNELDRRTNEGAEDE